MPNNDGTDLPFYVEGPANVVGNLPYIGYGATLQGFMFNGDRARLQRVCDTMLNRPAGGAVNFSVVTSQVFLSALYQPRVQSADPADQSAGYVPEIDVGFWTLTFGGRTDKVADWAFRWLPIWLFVDNGAAIATGREVFGYPKMQARFEGKTANSTNPTDASVGVWTHVFETFQHDECAKEFKLFSLTPSGGPTPAKGGHAMTLDKSAADFRSVIRGDNQLIGQSLPFDGLMPPMISMLKVKMPMVFLKQFRDVSEVRRACYQAITAVGVETLDVLDIGTFATTYRLQIEVAASHPIEELLGIESGAEPSFSFWAKQNFLVGFGEKIWTA
jgi:hypothetical protein